MVTETLKVYLYKKCSTCTKAVEYLKERNINFTAVEISETPPSHAELLEMLNYQAGNMRKLFNTSGLLYKEMGLSQKLDTLCEQDALQLLHQHGMLVKRPFLIGKRLGLTGFNQSVWDKELQR